MGFLDRLFGTPDPEASRSVPRVPQAPRAQSDDERAIERYRYLLRTAPPESIEAVHAEAFAKLTPDQRAQVFRALSAEAPAGERLVSDEPSALARAATRAELRSPGTMERTFRATDAAGGRAAYGGPSFGSMVGGSMLGTVAGVVVGSMIAQAFLPGPDFGADVAGDVGTGGSDAGATTEASAADGGYGGYGDLGGDFGGGDFGGGDFGF
ncbi:hypothetical protein SAMN05428970_1967 [Agromyces sp. CF514]|uniref:hypothetical protein n=1 Tax=Agromyces sp. CF514 TaxID=1881031 RepID=UPI0008F2A324|nr:hypothetical protein [Agromyces sp. CF514]SFR75770.1 hypothetical protein SAMN05428970_1967 [Agromyces sp. CF514]